MAGFGCGDWGHARKVRMAEMGEGGFVPGDWGWGLSVERSPAARSNSTGSGGG